MNELDRNEPILPDKQKETNGQNEINPQDLPEEENNTSLSDAEATGDSAVKAEPESTGEEEEAEAADAAEDENDAEDAKDTEDKTAPFPPQRKTADWSM